MPASFQYQPLVSASRAQDFAGAGKTPTMDVSRSWDGVFGAASGSSQGNATRYAADSRFAGDIWDPSNFAGTAQAGMAAASGVAQQGVNAFGNTKGQIRAAEIQSEAMRRQSKNAMWGSILGGVLGIGAAFATPAPKIIMPKSG